MSTDEFLDHDGLLAIAHRGGSEEAPENTMAAFASAAALGFRYLETDVHLTADGVLVAFHDDRLDRVTDRGGLVRDLPWHEVANARIAGTETIPTLDDLLERFPDHRFNIDMKADETVLPLVAALRRHAALDRVCVASFSHTRLARARALLGPGVCTAASPREIGRLVAASRLRSPEERRRRAERNPNSFGCVQVPVRHRGVEVLTRRLVATAHAGGSQVHVWTVDDPAEMRRLIAMGVDGVITDRPSVLRTVLRSCDLWS